MNYWKYDGYRNSYLRTMWVTLAMLAVALILPPFVPSALAQRLNPVVPVVLTVFFVLGFSIAAYVRMRTIKRFVAQGQRTTARVVDAQHRYRVLFGVRPFTLTVQYEVDGVQRTASCFLEGKHKTLGAEVTVAVDPSKPTQCWPILEEWAS
jgi:hypothetical protein